MVFVWYAGADGVRPLREHHSARGAGGGRVGLPEVFRVDGRCQSIWVPGVNWQAISLVTCPCEGGVAGDRGVSQKPRCRLKRPTQGVDPFFCVHGSNIWMIFLLKWGGVAWEDRLTTRQEGNTTVQRADTQKAIFFFFVSERRKRNLRLASIAVKSKEVCVLGHWI